MSDLQCAATVVVLGPTTASPALLAQLHERRVALVYAGGGPGTTVGATRLARDLRVAVRRVTASAPGPDDGAGAADVPERDAMPEAVSVFRTALASVPATGAASVPAFDAVLDDLADEHRGECVVLVIDDGALAALARRSGRDGATGMIIDLDDDGRQVGELPAC
ncbi:hypothetical protein V2J52_15895 [Georgenia sp. MJ173]|uniref:hypothetical protein n=1 Tax=Georgenia sunbinii TaxID=3117728 RepID=UPI002F2618F5